MTDTISTAAGRTWVMLPAAAGAVCTVYWALQRWSSHQRLWKDSNVSNVGHWARVVGYPHPQFSKMFLDMFRSTFTSRETWSIKAAPVRIRYNVDRMMGLPAHHHKAVTQFSPHSVSVLRPLVLWLFVLCRPPHPHPGCCTCTRGCVEWGQCKLCRVPQFWTSMLWQTR